MSHYITVQTSYTQAPGPQPPAPPEGSYCPRCFQPVYPDLRYVAVSGPYGWTYWHRSHYQTGDCA